MPGWLWVGLGGFLGSVLRYGVSGLAYRLAPTRSLPLGTAAVNIAGSLCIGLLAGLAESRGVLDSRARLFLMLGVLGGFTTFSTFTYETVQLWRDAQFAMGLTNILVQVLAGIAAVLGGYALARALGGG